MLLSGNGIYRWITHGYRNSRGSFWSQNQKFWGHKETHVYFWSCVLCHRICNHEREISKLLKKVDHFCACEADIWKFGSRNRRGVFGLRIKNSEGVRKLMVTYEAAIESAITRWKFPSCWRRSTTSVDVGQMFASSNLGTEGEFSVSESKILKV